MTFIETIPSRLRPTFPDLAARDEELDSLADEMMRRYLRDARQTVSYHEFDIRFGKSVEFLLPFLGRYFPKKKLRALEVGCGHGAKAMALAHLFEEYVGIDIVPDVIQHARRTANAFGLKNAQFIADEAANIEKFLASSEKRFDLIILYAILEHLTPAEKLGVLRLCWDHLAPDGYLFIGEAPNRMFPIDYHSSKLLYFQQMPLQLWQRYYDRSPNEAWRQVMRSGLEAGNFEHTAYRRGLHVGHQEFELGLAPLSELIAHVAADNYALPMLNLYPYEPVEYLKLCEFEQLDEFPSGVNLVPIKFPSFFSRYYLEALLRKGPERTEAAGGLRVLAPGQSGLQFNRKFCDGHELAHGARLVIPPEALPAGASPMIGVTMSVFKPARGGAIIVEDARGVQICEVRPAEIMRSISTWRRHVAFKLPQIAADRFPLSLRAMSAPITLSFVFLRREAVAA